MHEIKTINNKQYESNVRHDINSIFKIPERENN